MPADVSTPEGPSDAVNAAVAAFGGLDLLLVNSGGPPPGTFDELDEAAWQTAIDGTLWSAIRLIRAALPHLRQSDRPAILVILSSSTREPIPGLTTSNLLRPGLAGLIKSLVADALGLHLDLFQRISVEPCSITAIRYTRLRPFLVRLGDTGDFASLAPREEPPNGDAAVGGGAGAP